MTGGVVLEHLILGKEVERRAEDLRDRPIGS